MARAETLGRLHQRNPDLPRQDVATAASAPPIPARSSFRRFRWPGPQETEGGCQLTPPEIMSVCQPAVGLDRGRQFQELAERERLAEVMRRLLLVNRCRATARPAQSRTVPRA
jgi:hypothetical protein